MLSQVRKSRLFVLLVNKSSQVTTLQQHRRKELGAKQRKPNDTVADLNNIVEEEGEESEKLKEAMVDKEIKNGRHKVFNFHMRRLDTKKINDKLEVFNELDSAAKINIAL